MGMFSKKPLIGLDMGHYSIKAVQAERHGAGWRLIKVAEILTPKDAIKDGVVVDQHAMSYAIKDLITENKLQIGGVHVGVAGGSVMVRHVRIPRMSEATLRKTIKFEASRYVPTSAEESFIEFEIIGPADENQMDVIVVAAPKELVRSRLQVLEALGIDVESVDIEVFAGYRSLIEADPSQDWSTSTFCLVDIGAVSAKLSVIQQGAFVMTRSIPGGGAVLTEALKNYFKLSDADAESGKAQLDASTLAEPNASVENPPLRVIQPHLDDLIREIRRSLNYHQSQLAEPTSANQVSYVLLTGGGARMPGLARYVEHKLGIKTLTAGVFNNPRFTHTTSRTDGGSEMSVAVGLAMRSYSKAA
jgi:type IV pilus assembly protein PilM